MEIKDYYTILDLPPSATPDEIRKAYRKLALVYHPDKAGNDLYALAKFTEIKEAYETLTNPTRKALYLQHRWYAKSMGKPLSGASITPVSLLQRVLELDKYARTLDFHRMDEQGLGDYMLELFSQETIEKVNHFADGPVISEIIKAITRTLQILSYPNVLKVIAQLKKLQPVDSTTHVSLDKILKQKRINHFWEKQRITLVLALVLVICLMIYILTQAGSS